MTEEELTQMDLDAELWLRQLRNDFMEHWENPEPPPFELEDEMTYDDF